MLHAAAENLSKMAENSALLVSEDNGTAEH
jgi:hypothetical protein